MYFYALLVFSKQKPILWRQLIVLQFTLTPTGISTYPTLMAQSNKTTPHFRYQPQMSPQAIHTSAWPSTSLGVPMIPLRFTNLLLPHRTQEKTTLKITGLLEYNSGTTQWKRLIGQGMKAQNFILFLDTMPSTNERSALHLSSLSDLQEHNS